MRTPSHQPEQEENFFKNFLIRSAGADPEVLHHCPSEERTRYLIIGSCVLIPALLGTFSGGYAISLISDTPWLPYVFGPIWGLVIYLIDRAVVSGMSGRGFTPSVALRVLLAIIIALIVSVPLELRLFDDELNELLREDLIERQRTAEARCEQQLAQQDRLLSEQQTKVDSLWGVYTGEIDGTRGTGLRDIGPVAKEKFKKYQREKQLRDSLAQAIQERKKEIEVNLQDRLSDINNYHSAGILKRIRLLGELTDRDWHASYAVWLIRSLFLLLELIPILTKMTSPPGGTYDYFVKVRAKMYNDWNGEKAEQQKQQRVLETRLKARLQRMKLERQNLEQEIQHQEDQLRFLNKKLIEVASAQTTFEEKLLQLQSEKVRLDLIEQSQRVFDEFVAFLRTLINQLGAPSA